ncbi:MAG TPA: hypothetical protein VGK64_14685 [Bryobacteraceae bacterium]
MDFSSSELCSRCCWNALWLEFRFGRLCFGIPFDAQLSAASWTIELGGFGLDVPTTQALNAINRRLAHVGVGLLSFRPHLPVSS